MNKKIFSIIILVSIFIFPLKSFALLLPTIEGDPVECDKPCTNYVYSEWGNCKSNGIRNREIIEKHPGLDCDISKSNMIEIHYCSNGVRPITEESCIPICTDVIYSDWENECINGKQYRTVENYYPSNCEEGIKNDEILTQDCVACTGRIYSNWSDCIDNQQERVVLYNTPSGCVGEPTADPVIYQSCNKDIICNNWTYSDWSTCIDNQQSRTIISSYPEDCVDGEPFLVRVCENESNNNVSNKTNTNLSNRLKGKLLLQVNQGGRIWYVNPDDAKRFEITFANALPLFENFALGITDDNLRDIPKYDENWSSALGNRLKGKLLLQVEQGGRIWYVDFNGKRWEVTWDNLMELFESLALGITDDDLNGIERGEL